MPALQTHRLTITPFTLARVEAALHDRPTLARDLDATVPDEWPNPDIAEILPMILEGRRHDPAAALWSGLIIHRADRTLIGDIGFLGPPGLSGVVEIGYGLIPAYRGRGLATEAARAMVAWAFTQPGVRRVIADCLADNPASARVLEKVGFARAGSRHTEEGLLLMWAIDRPPPSEDAA